MAQQNTGGFGVAHPVPYTPKSEEPVDTNPSDKQPPGVDEKIDYNTLEEALTS
tara:strand:+ start:366 stop:524 length:159 start_codon:yes stop_codon:yes gene_type:complete